ncbi:ankyrin repeat and SOCS box protein 12a [Chiloscyllium plagiosum]|uniref:ankyrin repeat and SOCS box protein 12a n=1 Tax=Chiloscyllium plagiosum TaxID=36176 RepID=UPI001CB7C223|nr:ankyrin repeat and SOCS box protein 12a [Chiloscyllium plagiosum]
MELDIMWPIEMSLVDITKIFSMFQPTEEEGNGEISQLNQAISNDDDKLLAELLCQERYRRFINSRSGWGVPGTPLRLAASMGHLKCLEALLAHGAEVDSLDVKAQTPLFTAVSGKHLDCVQALLRAGANPNGSIYNNSSPLLIAAREGDVEILKELLDHGAEVNVRCKMPNWAYNPCACSGPLYLALVYGHFDCFRLLLLYGANPDFNSTEERLLSRIKSPKTALEMCFKYGCGTEYVQLLIDFGANLYLPDLSASKNIKQNEVLKLLDRARAQPRCLMSLSRITIRKYLKQASGLHSIDQLNIPPILKDYVKHHLS